MKTPLIIVGVLEGYPTAKMLEKSEIGVNFRCKTIQEGNPYYLHVVVEWSQNADAPIIEIPLLIPHQYVVLILKDAPQGTLGFHSKESS